MSAQFSTPRNGEKPIAPQLAEQIKSFQTAELKQILVAILQVMDARQAPNRSPSESENASLSQTHEVSSILHCLIKEEALRKISLNYLFLVGRWLRERHHLSSGPMKTYRDSAMMERIQRSLKGAAADMVHNMDLGASLDMIIKKLSMIYGNVKSYDLLIGDFYRQTRERRKQSPCLTYGLRVSCLK